MSTANPPFATPSHDDIAQCARALWLSRGSPNDQDEAIWLEAERQLLVGLRASGAMPAPMSPEEKRSRGEPVIDEGELLARLNSFGRTAQNSPTALDLT